MRAISVVALAVSTAALATSLPFAAHAAPTASAPEGSSVAVAAQKRAAEQIRFATFNVRTSRADIGTSRHWLRRAATVAREIKAENPDVVALQELGPGRADGKATKIGTSARQTTSLLSALRSVGAGQYKMVRVTSYVAPGTKHSTQGTRLLYNANRVRLISKCPETTGKSNYNKSCSMDMPAFSKATARSAAFAEFEDKKTGRNFFAASVHLINTHSGSLAKERKLDALRRSQVAAVYGKVSKLAGGKPIIFGGDINSWKTKKGSHAPFNYLAAQGFRDSTTARYQLNSRYPTVNHWHRTLKANAVGRQVALDVIMVKGGKGFNRYENVMKVVDTFRASDHNMVVTDLNL